MAYLMKLVSNIQQQAHNQIIAQQNKYVAYANSHHLKNLKESAQEIVTPLVIILIIT